MLTQLIILQERTYLLIIYHFTRKNYTHWVANSVDSIKKASIWPFFNSFYNWSLVPLLAQLGNRRLWNFVISGWVSIQLAQTTFRGLMIFPNSSKSLENVEQWKLSMGKIMWVSEFKARLVSTIYVLNSLGWIPRKIFFLIEPKIAFEVERGWVNPVDTVNLTV